MSAPTVGETVDVWDPSNGHVGDPNYRLGRYRVVTATDSLVVVERHIAGDSRVDQVTIDIARHPDCLRRAYRPMLGDMVEYTSTGGTHRFRVSAIWDDDHVIIERWIGGTRPRMKHTASVHACELRWIS